MAWAREIFFLPRSSFLVAKSASDLLLSDWLDLIDKGLGKMLLIRAIVTEQFESNPGIASFQLGCFFLILFIKMCHQQQKTVLTRVKHNVVRTILRMLDQRTDGASNNGVNVSPTSIADEKRKDFCIFRESKKQCLRPLQRCSSQQERDKP